MLHKHLKKEKENGKKKKKTKHLINTNSNFNSNRKKRKKYYKYIPTRSRMELPRLPKHPITSNSDSISGDTTMFAAISENKKKIKRRRERMKN